MSFTLNSDEVHNKKHVMALVKADKREGLTDRFYYGHEVETQTPWPTILREADHLDRAIINNDTSDRLAQEFLEETHWAPMADGSVAGVEYKSPLIRTTTELHERIVRHINQSTKNERCGGHIHIFNPSIDNAEITKHLRTFKWLLVLLYFKRRENTYCPLTDNHGQKYCWLHKHPQGSTEIRLFTAPDTVDIMKFRMRLLDAMLGMETPPSYLDAIRAFFNEENMRMLRARMSFKTAASIAKRTGGKNYNMFATTRFNGSANYNVYGGRDTAPNTTLTWTKECIDELRKYWNELVASYPEERRQPPAQQAEEAPLRPQQPHRDEHGRFAPAPVLNS